MTNVLSAREFFKASGIHCCEVVRDDNSGSYTRAWDTQPPDIQRLARHLAKQRSDRDRAYAERVERELTRLAARDMATSRHT
jgi:hypothetical protein